MKIKIKNSISNILMIFLIAVFCWAIFSPNYSQAQTCPPNSMPFNNECLCDSGLFDIKCYVEPKNPDCRVIPFCAGEWKTACGTNETSQNKRCGGTEEEMNCCIAGGGGSSSTSTGSTSTGSTSTGSTSTGSTSTGSTSTGSTSSGGGGLKCSSGFEKIGGVCMPTSSKVGLFDGSILDVLDIVLRFILSATAILAILAIVVGGVLYIISVGDTDGVKRAKAIIVGGVIGLVVVLVAYSIVQTISYLLIYGDTF